MQIELDTQEIILGRVRMHRVLLWRRIVIGLLVVFFLCSNSILLFRVGWLGAFVFFFCGIAVIVYLFQAHAMWNHTMWLITSKRIIDIYQPYFFTREITDIPLADIEEVNTTEEKTWLDRVFGAGTVRVQGAPEKDFDLEMHHIPRPHIVTELIMEAQKVYKHHT